ncbi:UNVERIFIED_CONTAM: hypothetical protein FKN15_036721 [Acipenser sinensis]
MSPGLYTCKQHNSLEIQIAFGAVDGRYAENIEPAINKLRGQCPDNSSTCDFNIILSSHVQLLPISPDVFS